MLCILWLILAAAFAVGVIKVAWKLLKFVFAAGFLATAVLFISSLGLFL